MDTATLAAPQPMTKTIIDVGEKFPALPHAPSVEAIIDIRATPTDIPNEESLKNFVQEKFRNYQYRDSSRAIRYQATVSTNQPPTHTIQDMGWRGVHFQSEDQKYIAQFNRDGFTLNRLEPYQSWDQFQTEAMRLWNGYAEFVKPTQIHRVGLRYVNRIQMPAGELHFEDYIEVAPSTPKGLDLPVSGFMHQDTVVVAEHPYAVNIIKTVQPPNPLTGPGYGLILDIDVITTQPFDSDDTRLKNHLDEMRWLKNKVFFGTIKQKSLEMFQS